MTNQEKLEMLMTMMGISDSDANAEEKLSAYLSAAAKEIIAWRYSYSSAYPRVVEVPLEYEMTQINAVIAGYSISGAENQTQHSENGISRIFKYSDMVAYIRSNVIPLAGVF